MERLKELESSHESVKNAVFEKVKEKDHDLEKTITRIQDLHKSEQACLELKNIIFDEELKRTIFKIKLDEDQRSTENARKMFENLKKVWKIINEERNVILTTILGKEILEPSVNDALQRLKVFKRNQNELQEVLMAVSETDDPVTSKQAIEKVQELKSTEKAQYETIQKQSENLRRLETEISQMEKRYGSMKRDKEDVEQRLTNEIERLSEVAGAKLTNENPNITDLSDPNRPIKIAEQYSELYDNAWTDIFEKLTEKYKVSEKEAIQMLLHILEISYRFCAEIASTRLAVPDENKPNGGPKEETTKGKKQEIAQILSSDEIIVMQKFFDNPKQAVDNKTLKSVLEKIGVSETDMKNMKNLLKITVDGTCHFVEQHVWEKRSEIQAQDDVHLEITKPYLKKCVRICWLMVAQDPPVFLKTLDKKDNKFDKDLYREFTSSGKKMDHVVWPAILLHEGGPLLKKGVAQPK
ncbi:uncharacterized protein LOC134242845 [Saccostrea cucullata]|uniref:uncharacterized protein LOC134242845 n=1 Tax=Saccostrea cuccullata TaxID=36930 RepID=UPI002ED04225